MKVAFVLLDPEVTGGQIVAHELMRGARRAGHEPLAILPRSGPMVTRLEQDGIPVRLLPLERSYRVDRALALARMLRRERIELVDTHTLFVADQLSRLAAACARVPLVAHAHIAERFSTRPAVARLQRAVARRSARRCARIVAVSDDLRATLVAGGVDPGRITVVRNGVAIGPPPQRTANEELRLVCAARLAPVKGQAVLLEALAAAGAGVRIAFAGADLERSGAYRRELEAMAERLGVRGQVEFLGLRDDLPHLLETADALVLPSFAEGLPLVALEAMERSRAVVATAVGGTPELVVDGVTGLLVAPGSVPELAAAIATLRDDRELVARLGDAGRTRVAAEFTLAETVARTLAVFEAAVARGGTTGSA